MNRKTSERKKISIFKMFLIWLLIIMLVQSAITIGTLATRRVGSTLAQYASGIMSRQVENRRVTLQGDMNQRWALVREQEGVMNDRLSQYLEQRQMDLAKTLSSGELREELLQELFPICLNMLQSNSTTGIFLILTEGEMEQEKEFDGFYLRDSEPNKNPINYTDLLLERGSKQLSRLFDIPLDTNWTTRFRMEGIGKNAADYFFYEPWRAGVEYGDADTKDLGYWASPFSLGKNEMDSYEMITYSVPLRHEGEVYGVLGVEISEKYLNTYLPVEELNESKRSGYMLAIQKEDGSYQPLLGKGMLFELLLEKGSFMPEDTDYKNLYKVRDASLNRQEIYAVAYPLKIYGSNVPFQDTDWTLLGFSAEEDLFGMGKRLYFWMIVAVFAGLLFGVAGIFWVVEHLTRPVKWLVSCIGKGREGLQEFRPSNIHEVDALFDVVNDLTKKQRETESIILEEKERYRMALDASEDIFFTYDFKEKMLDIVNHKTMSGQWRCADGTDKLIRPEYIHEEDRDKAMEDLQKDSDALYAEFRICWPEETEYHWIAIIAKVIYNMDGGKSKLIGSIRNIQEQKKKELEQLRKNTIDGVSGLYACRAGKERLIEKRRENPCGVMVCLTLDGIRQATEKNGIVFGDMIIEEIGDMIRERRLMLAREKRAIAFLLNEDECILWLCGTLREEATQFVEGLLRDITNAFEQEMFAVKMYAGLAIGDKEQLADTLMRRAWLAAHFAISSMGRQLVFYEDVPVESTSPLPDLQEQEINRQGYGEGTSLVSVALNLFGKGEDFAAKMTLMIRKIGRFYHVGDVLVSLLQPDFNASYVNYQWHKRGEADKEAVRKYTDEEKEAFYRFLGEEKVRYFSKEDGKTEMLRCFLGIKSGQSGVILPLYDNGNYMGNLCIPGIMKEFLEKKEEYHALSELGRAIEGQLNQEQHDIASKAKSEFLSRMSHEIRTPMNGIIGMTAIALQQGQSPERMLDCLQKIQVSSSYLLGLINDILDMSKIESGKMKLEPVSFHMEEMLGTVKELIRTQAAAKNIEFTQHTKLTHLWFFADRMRISQVIVNLLGNAVKFTPKDGKITLSVEEVSCGEKEAVVSFAVEDTGIGIAKEDQDRVFRSFEQAGTGSAKQQGTGLGLSISSRLIQLMGSSIRLESEPGVGSKFSFAIPLAYGESEEIQEPMEEVSFEGLRVLVVEDNELNTEIARCLLEERGFEVDCVYDGLQAVERMKEAESGKYDVILMDIMMPVMDGLEASRIIRSMDKEYCRTVPIIAMSANAFDEDLKKSVECGMNGHLSKPVDVDKLYRTLHEILRKDRG